MKAVEVFVRHSDASLGWRRGVHHQPGTRKTNTAKRRLVKETGKRHGGTHTKKRERERVSVFENPLLYDWSGEGGLQLRHVVLLVVKEHAGVLARGHARAFEHRGRGLARWLALQERGRKRERRLLKTMRSEQEEENNNVTYEYRFE